MSKEYNEYIKQHKENVIKGYNWMVERIPEIIGFPYDPKEAHNWNSNMLRHDESKYGVEEYDAYDKYFYGKNKSYNVVQDFKLAWLNHIHHNPHHWQYWILHNDEPGEGLVVLDMPLMYIVEMISDWWAFSWAKGNLFEIFNWYDQHKDYMKLSDRTRSTVEYILNNLKVKLEEENKDE